MAMFVNRLIPPFAVVAAGATGFAFLDGAIPFPAAIAFLCLAFAVALIPKL